MSESKPRSGSFLSLKWQAVFSVSLVLILGTGLLTYVGHRNLQESFATERERVFSDRQNIVTGSLQALQLQMQRLAGHLQGQAALSPELGRRSALVTTIDQNWDQLNFEWGLDSLLLLDAENQQISSWGEPLSQATLPSDWLSSARQEESPVSQIWCPRTCVQIEIVPTFSDETKPFLMVLTSSLTDAVLNFQANTAADIGILVAQTEDPQRVSQKQLQYWHYEITALTGAPVTLDLLRGLSAENSFEQVANQRTMRSLNGETYEISFIPFSTSLQQEIAHLVVIENVTDEMARLDSLRNYLLGLSGIVLIISELVLLMMLWLPMRRLQKLAKVLPQLAGNHTENIQSLQLSAGHRDLVRNEIHEIFDASISLSHTLQELDETVRSRTQRLKNRSQELLRERNFVTSLLNNVHVVILTQDLKGYVKLLNSEGTKLIDFDNPDAQRVNFADYLQPADRARFFDGIKGLDEDGANEFRQELEFRDLNNASLHMEWYHSRLPIMEIGDELVLSVGLDLTARKVAEKNLAWLADHDPLTQLYNRRRFQREFERVLRDYDDVREPGALIFFDIDQFKTVNDTSGHPVGDQLLRDIASKLRALTRPGDTIARLGGDEFAILLEKTDRAHAALFARRFCEQASDIQVIDKNSTHRISLSIGIALYPEHGAVLEELMANADLAMYKAKASTNARSNWEVYSVDAPDKEELYYRVNWKRRIEHALEEDRFVLYFQPLLDIASNTVSHYEALVRMVGSDGEIIPPGAFIPVAEKTGLIYEIDVHVIKLAAKALEKFEREGKNIKLSVNLSAKAISNKQFIDLVEREITSRGLERSKIIFELTETSAVEDLEAAATVIEHFRKVGYEFSLDDFGVGFSSWYYLRQLPVDYVKIDGSFVRELSSSIEDRLFVKAINDVAQGLGKKTVAEFVENRQSLALLAAMGVNYAQGYHIGKPQPHLCSESDTAGVIRVQN